MRSLRASLWCSLAAGRIRSGNSGGARLPLTLAKKLTNPFSDVVNVPLQQNPDFGLGAGDEWRYTISLQPVTPFGLDRGWHLISRTVAPAIYHDGGEAQEFGLGDISLSVFLSPTHASEEGWFWGIGPTYDWTNDQWTAPLQLVVRHCSSRSSNA